MTAPSTDPRRTSGPGSLRETLTAIVTWFADSSRGAAALETCRKLASLSDSQLSTRGLKRGKIVRHAFAPYYYG